MNRSSFHLPGSELILYLGLQKKRINAWTACEPKQNAKVFPVCENKMSAGKSAAQLHFLGLISETLDEDFKALKTLIHSPQKYTNVVFLSTNAAV